MRLADGTYQYSPVASSTTDFSPSARLAFPSSQNSARHLCGLSNPSTSGTIFSSDQFASVAQDDGALTNSSCGANLNSVHAFQLDVLTGVKDQLGMSGLTAATLPGRLSSLALAWTGYGTAGSTAGSRLMVWKPSTSSWQEVGDLFASDRPERHVVTIASPADFVDSTGRIWVGVKANTSSSGSALYSDQVQLYAGITPVGSVAATVDGSGQVTLTWGEGGGSLYHVYRTSTSGTDYLQLTDLPVTSPYTDITVPGGRTYYYVVRRLEPNGDLGTPSAEVSAVVSSYSHPADPVPTALGDPDSVSLQWSAVSGATGYLIYRAEASSSWYERLTAQPVSGTSWKDNSPVPGGKYRVVAVDSAGRSSDSLTNHSAAFGVGRYDDSNPGFVYVGTWSNTTASTGSLLDSLHTGGSGASASIKFKTAREVRVLAAKGPNYGVMEIYLNGSLFSQVDLYSPSPLLKQEVFQLEDIRSSSGTIEVRWTGSKNASSSGTDITLDGILILPGGKPALLEATGTSYGVTLKWMGTSDAFGYKVVRATTPGGPYSVVSLYVEGTTYTDESVQLGTTYYYVVFGLNSGGAPEFESNEASTKAVPDRSGIDGRWPYTTFQLGNASAYPPCQDRRDTCSPRN